MTKTITLKRTLTFILALSMLLCCVSAFGSVQASAATDRVSMYFYEPTFIKYGYTSSNIYIQTKDNASNQQVFVHYNYREGYDWEDAQATYLTTLSDGSKIWKASIGSYNMEYAIKYVADGQTIWDNNNGNNYKRQILGTAPITVMKDFSSSYVKISVVLKNYGYQKNVFLRYTLDNWASYRDISMAYESTNDDGTEIWSVTLPLDSYQLNSFEYCVCYQVNGQTYWANNFGENYDSNYVIHH